jgi:hypothetical protein
MFSLGIWCTFWPLVLVKMNVPFDIYYDYSSSEKGGLDKVYHKGQDKIWNGKDVLDSLLERYNNFELDPEHSFALQNILSIIWWGEYAAWSVASDMSARFDDYGAKMAAVSQAHDEARHFYVIGDYLKKRLDYKPEIVSKSALNILESVSKTNNLAKKLLGMQLMVEPIAITIFRFLRKSNIDPALSELLVYFEKDESRHMALGVKYLPKLLKNMSSLELAGFLLWQIRMINYEIKGLKFIEDDLLKLNIKPIEVFEFAEKKQIECLKSLSREMNVSDNLWKPVVRIISFRKHLAFYPKKNHNIFKKVMNSFFGATRN